MDMSGEQRIPAPRRAVWEALNNPDVLRACIPGCQELVKLSDTEMSATVVMKVGPVRAQFAGAVTLSDLDPPAGYRIAGEGQGGMAGFAKGEAWVRLEDAGDQTILRYEVRAQIGGKLAQLGARLIDVTAKQMSAAFFARFAELVSSQPAGGNVAPGVDDETASGPPGAGSVASEIVARKEYLSPAAFPMRAGIRQLAGMGLLSASLLVSAYLLSGSLAGTPGAGLAVSANFIAAVFLIFACALGYMAGYMHAKTKVR